MPEAISSEFVRWPDAVSPLHIEYAPAVMEQIRLKALDGLKALPRTGIGVGGLLLGERAGVSIRITGFIELPCSHTYGPAFLLTPEEKLQGRELVRGAPVVGWYCTRTRGEIALDPADLELFKDLFPALWQITLVMRPSLARRTSAAFFFTDRNGAMQKGSEGDLPEWDLSAPAPVAVAVPDEIPPEPVPFRFHALENRPRGTGPLRWIVIAVVAMAVGAAAFEVRNWWQMNADPSQTAPIPGSALPQRP